MFDFSNPNFETDQKTLNLEMVVVVTMTIMMMT
jgi:hypothetical protein